MKKKTIVAIAMALSLGAGAGLFTTYYTNHANANDTAAQGEETTSQKPVVLEQSSQEAALKKVKFGNKVKTLKDIPYENKESASTYDISNEESVYDVDFFGKNGEVINLSVVNDEVDTVLPDGANVKIESLSLPGGIEAKLYIEGEASQLKWMEDGRLTYTLSINDKALEKINGNNLQGQYTKIYNQMKKL